MYPPSLVVNDVLANCLWTGVRGEGGAEARFVTITDFLGVNYLMADFYHGWHQ